MKIKVYENNGEYLVVCSDAADTKAVVSALLELSGGTVKKIEGLNKIEAPDNPPPIKGKELAVDVSYSKRYISQPALRNKAEALIKTYGYHSLSEFFENAAAEEIREVHRYLIITV